MSPDKDKITDDTRIRFRKNDLRRSSGRQLVELWARFPLEILKSISFKCCALSGRVSTMTRSLNQRSPTQYVFVLLSAIRCKITPYTYKE